MRGIKYKVTPHVPSTTVGITHIHRRVVSFVGQDSNWKEFVIPEKALEKVLRGIPLINMNSLNAHAKKHIDAHVQAVTKERVLSILSQLAIKGDIGVISEFGRGRHVIALGSSDLVRHAVLSNLHQNKLTIEKVVKKTKLTREQLIKGLYTYGDTIDLEIVKRVGQTFNFRLEWIEWTRTS